MASIIGYGVSPMDLIPDFIPVLGQIYDLVIVPGEIALVLKMIPKNVWKNVDKKPELNLLPLEQNGL